jgi:PPOX class probable F420-dependent enzyme
VAPASLDDPRVRAFLAPLRVAVLATLDPDGAPLALPMWFLPDGPTLVMVSEAGTRKVRNLLRDGRVAVALDGGQGGGAVRAVAVQGRAEVLGESPERRALVGGLLARYHPHLAARWGGETMPADRVLFRVVPSRVATWGLA